MEVKRYPVKEIGIWIKNLYEMYKKGTLKLNPEFQRSYVWKNIRGKREKLIDSMLRDFDIGKIFLREIKKISDGEPVVTYVCLDGQQRLRSIFDFMDDNYTTSSKITKELGSSKKFSDLEPRHQVKIRDIKIRPIVVETTDDEMISDIFMRLQEGVPLRGPERLNAERGFMRNTIVDLSKHDFFDKTLIRPFRFAFRYLAAQIMRLEEQNVTETLKFVNIGYKELRAMYRQYKSNEEEAKIKRLAEKIKSNLNFLSKTLHRDAEAIWSKSDFVNIYLLTSYLREKYVISGKEEIFKNAILQFMRKVETGELEKEGYTRYATTSGKKLKEKFELISREFLNFVPDLRLKDEKRGFDWGQRLAIYIRQEGKCRKCGQPVNISEAELHHVVPFEEGGPTTVENGEMYHPKCHPR